MTTTMSRFAEVAALAGDPARATMLHALMDGRALTAGELAAAAGITAPTASGHLARLTAAGLVVVAKQGRHRYHRLATPAVAAMLESVMQVAAGARVPARAPTGPKDAAMRLARTCYDHLAGHLAVALADALQARGYVELGPDAGVVTPAGEAFFDELGLALDRAAGRRTRRVFCRPCLDWSERRPHLAGMLGAALCTSSLERGWIRRRSESRAVLVTPEGRRAYKALFGVDTEVRPVAD